MQEILTGGQALGGLWLSSKQLSVILPPLGVQVVQRKPADPLFSCAASPLISQVSESWHQQRSPLRGHFLGHPCWNLPQWGHPFVPVTVCASHTTQSGCQLDSEPVPKLPFQTMSLTLTSVRFAGSKPQDTIRSARHLLGISMPFGQRPPETQL